MKTYSLLILSLFWAQISQAQLDSTAAIVRSESRQQAGYFEKITYYGDHRQYYTVSTYLKDSTLYRIDNYKLLDQVNVYGYQSDTKKVAVRQGPVKIMFPTGKIYLSCDYKQGSIDGPLMLFYADGSIKRRELYKEGRIEQSHCYTQQGNEEPCAPLYQLPQFTGKSKDLQRYLEKNLQTITEIEQVKDIKIILTINELGQVVGTEVVSNSNPDDLKLITVVRQVIQDMPQWTPHSFNWKPASMDGVPVTEKVAIYVDRKKGFLYVYSP